MAYKSLGTRPVTASLNASPTSNPGNWSALMPSSIMAVSVPNFELYRFSVINGPLGSTLTALLDQDVFTVTPAGTGDNNTWVAFQPLEINKGQTLSFFWNSSTATSPAPLVTCFFRYSTF